MTPTLLRVLVLLLCSFASTEAASVTPLEIQQQQQLEPEAACSATTLASNVSLSVNITTTTTNNVHQHQQQQQQEQKQQQSTTGAAQSEQQEHHGENKNQEEGVVDVMFINFANHAVPLWWYNPIWNDYDEIALLEPFGSKQITSYVGHVFAYDMLNTPRIQYKITSPGSGNASNKIHLIGIDHHKAANYYQDKNDYPTRHVSLQDEKDPSVKVECSTTQGDLGIVVKPKWSPLGAARFLELVVAKYYNGCAIHRVLPGFITQFGIGANYEQRKQYNNLPILDDDNTAPQKFQPGSISFAANGPNSRTTQIFIVASDISAQNLERLGENPWEIPFGYVEDDEANNVHSSTVLSKWYGEYGDTLPWNENGPDPKRILQLQDGYQYLQEEFPKLDYIQSCRIVG